MSLIYAINSHLAKRIEANELSNEEVLSTIKLLGSYLNLCTISQYATENSMTYSGVLLSPKCKIVELFGAKFVVDNE